MNDLKKFINALLDMTRFGIVPGCLLLGLSTSAPLFARQSAGHTVTIRIIRPIQFSVKPVENRLQAGPGLKNNEVQLNWQSDSKPKKVTVSRKSGNPGSTLDLVLSGENRQKSRSRIRLGAVEAILAGALTQTAGSLTLRVDSGSKSRGVSEDTNERIFYTVCDI
jgi:hypothetical protein